MSTKHNNLTIWLVKSTWGIRPVDNCKPTYLLFLEQDVDWSEIFSVIIRLQLSVERGQPLVEVGAALGEQLGLVGVKQTFGFGLSGGLQILPHGLQWRELFLHHGLSLWFLGHERLSVLQHTNRDYTLFLLWMWRSRVRSVPSQSCPATPCWTAVQPWRPGASATCCAGSWPRRTSCPGPSASSRWSTKRAEDIWTNTVSRWSQRPRLCPKPLPSHCNVQLIFSLRSQIILFSLLS